MVQVPLIVDAESGVNDYLDRDGSRTPVTFHISNDRDAAPDRRRGRPGGDQVEEDGAAAVRDGAGRGAAAPTCAPCARTTSSTTTTPPTSTSGTGSRRSAPRTATLDYLTATVRAIWKVLKEAERAPPRPSGRRSPTRAIPSCPDELEFLHAEDILDAYPDLPRKQRETGDPAGAPGGLHLRDRLAARGRLPARAARRRLRRLVDGDGLGGRPPDARAERRHPGLEPGHAPAARADVGRHPRRRRSRCGGSWSSRASSTSSSSRTTGRS